MTEKDPKDMTDAEWLEWYRDQPKGPKLSREESIKWLAARGRMLNPTEKERIVDQLLLNLPIDDKET
jgi:hypothetical protein